KLLTQDATGVQVVISTDAPENAELVTVPLVQHGIDHLRAACDYVILDTPTNFSHQVLAAIDASDAIVVVSEPHVASLKAARDWFDILAKLSYPKERSNLVINRTTQAGLETDQVSRMIDRRPDLV